ncbi:MAG: LysE family transporter [Kiloniellaceae bacterium]
MDTATTLVSIAAVWGLAVVTPGPNFIVTLRSATAFSRWHGLAAAAGITTGTAIWGLAGFFGISTLFAVAPWLYAAFKVFGGLYLVYLGARLIYASLRSRPQAIAAALPGRPTQCAIWRLGLATNLSNPKTAAFVTSLFATTLPAEPSVTLGLMAAAAMAAISIAWYASVAWIFSAPAMTGVYGRIAHLIDRVAGGIFVAFGAKLALDR